MKLSVESDYALRVVYAFSRLEPGTYLTADAIAADAGIPETSAAGILLRLLEGGIVTKAMLADGGYRLARPRNEISLLDVIEAVEGKLHLSQCLMSTGLCNLGRAPECKVHRALAFVQNGLLRDLKAVNFENL